MLDLNPRNLAVFDIPRGTCDLMDIPLLKFSSSFFVYRCWALFFDSYFCFDCNSGQGAGNEEGLMSYVF